MKTDSQATTPALSPLLATALAASIEQVLGHTVESSAIELSRPDEQFGDFASNIALKLAGQQSSQPSQNPRQIAEQIAADLRQRLADTVSEVSVAGPGFINLRLSDAALRAAAQAQPSKAWAGKTVVTEYSDPNPFKVLHVGHLYTSVVGDAISNLLALAGAEVHRVNFGGDVGLHVGRTMWAILQELGGEYPEKLADIPQDGRAEWMASAYVRGTQAYDDDPEAKQQIIELNKRVYQLHAENDHDSAFSRVYWTCRQWSYDYFDAFYERIGSYFEKYYPESQNAPLGLETVKAHIADGVYTESDGAVVFKGEPYGLHTRVFINSEGLPTYEAKDVGVAIAKWQDYHFDESVIITGNDITEYMKVVIKSIEQFEPELAKRTRHLTHGNVKLAGGVKMSSRKGNFLRAVDVLDMVADVQQAATGNSDSATVLAAIKYAFIKPRMGADIIFSPEESVSVEGNSGPYLQYAHARARSILRKAADAVGDAVGDVEATAALEPDERSLLRKIAEYPDVIDKSLAELLPHHICTYLYELAQTFNRFYEKNLVVGDPRQALRLQLVEQYANTLKAGLELLGIAAPDKM
jgi:arginyl-tRNA synthetase